MAGEVTDRRDGSSTAILLNGHGTKLPSTRVILQFSVGFGLGHRSFCLR